jgi:putative transposase
VILASLCDAQTAGARLHAACEVIGISARTIERWRGQPGGDDRRCGPRRRPRNALTAAEEAQLLAVMTSAQYGRPQPRAVPLWTLLCRAVSASKTVISNYRSRALKQDIHEG